MTKKNKRLIEEYKSLLRDYIDFIDKLYDYSFTPQYYWREIEKLRKRAINLDVYFHFNEDKENICPICNGLGYYQDNFGEIEECDYCDGEGEL